MCTALSTKELSSLSPLVNLTTGRGTEEMEPGVTDDDGSELKRLVLKVGVGILIGFLELTAFLGNLLVCVSILTDRSLKQRKSNLFLVSLAVADMLVALVVMPFAVIKDVHGIWELGDTVCLLWIACDIMCVTASILSLCLICVDRFVQIQYPLHYQDTMTRTKIVTSITLVWLTGFLLSFVPIFSRWHEPESVVRDPKMCTFMVTFLYAVLSSCVSFYIPCIVVVVLYVRIFWLASLHSERVSRFKQPGAVIAKASDKLVKVSNSKAAVTLGVVVGVFLFCWLPFFILYSIHAYCPTCTPPVLFLVLNWLGYSNSCVNPFIYTVVNRDFRNAFHRKLALYRKTVSS